MPPRVPPRVPLRRRDADLDALRADAVRRFGVAFAVGATPQAVVALDGTLLRSNAALRRLLTASEETLVGSSIADLLDDPGAVEALLAEGRRRIGPVRARELTLTAYGRPTVLHVDLTPLDGDDGDTLYFFVELHDVTEWKSAERRLRGVLETASEAFVSINRGGMVTDWNGAAAQLFGWSRADAVGRSLADLIVPESMAGAHVAGVQHLANGGVPRRLGQRLELPARRADGTDIPVEITIWQTESGGDYHAFLRDISDRRRADDEATAQRSRLSAIVEAQVQMASAELTPDSVMRIACEAAQALTSATGAVIELVDGDELSYARTVGSLAPYEGLRIGLRTSLSGRAVAARTPMVCADSETDERVDRDACRIVSARSLLVVPLLIDGEAVGVVKSISDRPDAFSDEDVATLQLLGSPFANALANAWRLERTSAMALTDVLTGLPNRSHVLAELERALERQERYGGYVAAVFLDLDGFKEVNDVHGHAEGDRVLVAVGQALSSSIRTVDMAGRLGGDEFLVICEKVEDHGGAERVARRIQHAIADLAVGNRRWSGVTASIGVAVAGHRTTSTELVAAADAGMYASKRAGGGVVTIRTVPRHEPAPRGA